MSNIDNNNNHEVSLHPISNTIAQKLAKRSSNNNKYQFIFRIDNIVRETSKTAYEPKMVSIGPYHKGKYNLKRMEKYKLEYLQGILKRQNETSPNRYIDSLLQYEEDARICYAEQVTLNREEFVEMMLLDGCFIIEFLREYKKRKDRRHRDDKPIFKTESILEVIRRDLLLFENQIPFFILVKLFDMTKISSNNPTVAADDDDLISLAVNCLYSVVTKSENKSQSEDVLHLLDLMYESWCSSFAQSIYDDEKTQGIVQNDSISNRNNDRLPEFSCINFGRKNREEDDEEDVMCIKSVTELEQDGIKFVKEMQNTSWLDIKFEDGQLKIPHLVIHYSTESILRNLIAYEQYLWDSKKVVTDYTTFMDCLINTPKDVQKLLVKGIIKNWLGSDEEMTDIFINNYKNIFHSRLDFTYHKQFKDVNEHCKHRNNLWIRDLEKTYFNSP